MFSPTPEPPLAQPSSWREALRHAVDLTVAFTTLESYGIDDVWPPRHRTATGPLALAGARVAAVTDRAPGRSRHPTGGLDLTAGRLHTGSAEPADWPWPSPGDGRPGRGAETRRAGAPRTPAQHCIASRPAVPPRTPAASRDAVRAGSPSTRAASRHVVAAGTPATRTADPRSAASPRAAGTTRAATAAARALGARALPPAGRVRTPAA